MPVQKVNSALIKCKVSLNVVKSEKYNFRRGWTLTSQGSHRKLQGWQGLLYTLWSADLLVQNTYKTKSMLYKNIHEKNIA